MAKWGVWCIPPKGSNEVCGWLRDVNGPKPVRITFATHAEAEKECDILASFPMPNVWGYEPRRVLEKPKPAKKRKAKKR
jgi:hypothetical protein